MYLGVEIMILVIWGNHTRAKEVRISRVAPELTRFRH